MLVTMSYVARQRDGRVADSDESRAPFITASIAAVLAVNTILGTTIYRAINTYLKLSNKLPARAFLRSQTMDLLSPVPLRSRSI